MALVDHNGPVVPSAGTPCWDWLGYTMENGYGQFRLASDRVESAHAASYELFVGPIPEGHDVCHKCDRRGCVRPDHLFTGTRAENMADANTKGRLGKRSKLKAGDPDEIRSRFVAGEPQEALGVEFGISRAYVARLVQMGADKPCSTEWCPQAAIARGLCSRCYYAARRAGTLIVRTDSKTRPPEERFLAMVEKTDTCWLWTGATNDAGYGIFLMSVEKGPLSAHVASYVLFIGHVPEGLEVCHRCGVGRPNRACVRPDHLYAGTHTENMSDIRRVP